MTQPQSPASGSKAFSENRFASARETWLDAVRSALKGKPLGTWRSADGIAVAPLQQGAEGAEPVAGRAPGARWTIAQRIDHPDPAAANRLALADLAGGAGTLNLVGRGAPTARGFGVPVTSADALDEILADIRLDLIRLRLEAGAVTSAAVRGLVEHARGKGIAPDALDLAGGFDPVGHFAATGAFPTAWAEDIGGLARGFGGTLLAADGRPFHEAGASEAQEIAAILATAALYWRTLEQSGTDIDAGRRLIEFVSVADADPFMSIAKLRAVRLAWGRIEEASGIEPMPLRLHVETSWRMMTRRDPWTNLLRGGVAAFAAGVGGATSVTVLPFTTPLGLPDDFARRTARNVQHVLIEEANLHRVADPAAGSGSFEALTAALCDRAWAIFQAIEARGGILQALSSGWLQAEIAAVDAARPAPEILGSTRFAMAAEEPVAVLDVAPEPERKPADAPARLTAYRSSEAFEAMA
jgi:methylmalonyl-CoA mutase